MKKTILAKLKSDSGASLMAALLFFIMCATVGSIILAAATASSGRLAGLKRNEQAHYAVNSAADVFSEAIKGKQVVFKVSETNTPDGPSTNPVVFLNPTDITKEINKSNAFLPDLVSTVLNSRYPGLSYSDEFPDESLSALDPVTSTVTISADNFPDLDVVAKASMTSNLDLVMTFRSSTAGTGSEELTVKYTAVIDTKKGIENTDMQDTVVGTSDKRNGTNYKIYSISWTNPVFEAGRTEDD